MEQAASQKPCRFQFQEMHFWFWCIASRKRYKYLFAILLIKILDHFGSIFGLIKDKRSLLMIPCYSHTKIFFGFAKISRFPFLHELLLVREYLQLVAAQEKSIVNINDYQNNTLAYEFNIYTRTRSAFLETKVYKAFVEQLIPLKGCLLKTIDGLLKATDLWLVASYRFLHLACQIRRQF